MTCLLELEINDKLSTFVSARLTFVAFVLPCTNGSRFIDPLAEIATQIAMYGNETPSFCIGDFTTSSYVETSQMEPLGCQSLPFSSQLEFGTVAGQIPIPPFLQDYLEGHSLWTTATAATVTPTFCMGTRFGTAECDAFTFGMVLNSETVLALSEALPAVGPGGSLLALTEAIMKVTGMDQITIALSKGNGLEVPVSYYTHRSFAIDDFGANFFFTYQGKVNAATTASGKEVVQVKGPFQRVFHLGTKSDAVDKALNGILDSVSKTMSSPGVGPPDVVANFESMVTKYPEMIATDSPVLVDLGTVTHGLLKSFTIDGPKVTALNLPTKIAETRPGFYFSASGSVNDLKPIVEGLCTQLDGAMKAVSGRGCPEVSDLGEEGRLGLELHTTLAELVIQWPEFFFRCSIHDSGTRNPKMSCQVNDFIFVIVETDDGYDLGKGNDMSGSFIERVASISKDAVKAANGFGATIALAAKLSAHEEIEEDLNFQDEHKCKDSLRLWSSRARKDYKKYFSQSGNDDSESSCFESCYEWYLRHPAHEDETLCCSYETLSSYAECRVGHKGGESVSDKRKTASVTFVEDYERMANLPMLGSTCSEDEDCFSGFCQDSQCKSKCAEDKKCFASATSECFGQDEACIHLHGLRHTCDVNTGTCTCHGGKRCNAPEYPEVVLGLFEDKEDTSDTGTAE